MYPERYRTPAVTRHVLELLERRRPALATWDEAAEAKMRTEARAALEAAGRQFRDVADDAAHWSSVERAVLDVALPRYFRIAQERTAQEARGDDLWRGGDLLARITYAVVGLLGAALVVRLPGMAKWLEPLPLLFFVFGPLLPDFQRALLRRRHRAKLVALVEEMEEEAAQQATYRPLEAPTPEPMESLPQSGQTSQKERA